MRSSYVETLRRDADAAAAAEGGGGGSWGGLGGVEAAEGDESSDGENDEGRLMQGCGNLASCHAEDAVMLKFLGPSLGSAMAEVAAARAAAAQGRADGEPGDPDGDKARMEDFVLSLQAQKVGSAVMSWLLQYKGQTTQVGDETSEEEEEQPPSERGAEGEDSGEGGGDGSSSSVSSSTSEDERGATRRRPPVHYISINERNPADIARALREAVRKQEEDAARDDRRAERRQRRAEKQRRRQERERERLQQQQQQQEQQSRCEAEVGAATADANGGGASASGVSGAAAPAAAGEAERRPRRRRRKANAGARVEPSEGSLEEVLKEFIGRVLIQGLKGLRLRRVFGPHRAAGLVHLLRSLLRREAMAQRRTGRRTARLDHARIAKAVLDLRGGLELCEQMALMRRHAADSLLAPPSSRDREDWVALAEAEVRWRLLPQHWHKEEKAGMAAEAEAGAGAAKPPSGAASAEAAKPEGAVEAAGAGTQGPEREEDVPRRPGNGKGTEAACRASTGEPGGSGRADGVGGGGTNGYVDGEATAAQTAARQGGGGGGAAPDEPLDPGGAGGGGGRESSADVDAAEAARGGGSADAAASAASSAGTEAGAAPSAAREATTTVGQPEASAGPQSYREQLAEWMMRTVAPLWLRLAARADVTSGGPRVGRARIQLMDLAGAPLDRWIRLARLCERREGDWALLVLAEGVIPPPPPAAAPPPPPPPGNAAACGSGAPAAGAPRSSGSAAAASAAGGAGRRGKGAPSAAQALPPRMRLSDHPELCIQLVRRFEYRWPVVAVGGANLSALLHMHLAMRPLMEGTDCWVPLPLRPPPELLGSGAGSRRRPDPFRPEPGVPCCVAVQPAGYITAIQVISREGTELAAARCSFETLVSEIRSVLIAHDYVRITCEGLEELETTVLAIGKVRELLLTYHQRDCVCTSVPPADVRELGLKDSVVCTQEGGWASLVRVAETRMQPGRLRIWVQGLSRPAGRSLLQPSAMALVEQASLMYQHGHQQQRGAREAAQGGRRRVRGR